MSNLEGLLSKAASEYDEYPFEDYNGTSLGKGYSVILPCDIFYNYEIIKMHSSIIAVFITIIVHAYNDGIAFPSDSRIAILSGIHINKVRKALQKLIIMGICCRESENLVKIKKMPSRIDKRGFYFFQGIVFRGVWSVLSPAAKRLFLYYCWKSKPFPSIDNDCNRASIEDQMQSKEDYGRRIVPLEDLCPATIEETLGMSERTRRAARQFLDEMGLTYRLEGRDGLVLENNLQRVYPSVHERLAHAKRTASAVTGGTIRSGRSGKMRLAILPDEA